MKSTKTVNYPAICLGTWRLGGEGFGKQDLRQSCAVLERAYTLGIKLFDTASIYAHGKSEIILGNTLASQRKDIYLSTKGGLEWYKNTVIHDASPIALRNQLYQSLDRLKTDYIDHYFLHWPDPKTPIESSIQTLQSFKKEGLIHHWGLSNTKPSEAGKFIQKKTPYFHQLKFNPIHEPSLTDYAKYVPQAKLMAYSPLEQGLLITPDWKTSNPCLGKRDTRRKNHHFFNPTSLKKAFSFKKSTTNYYSLIQKLIDWYRLHPSIEAIIIGPKNIKQLNLWSDFIIDKASMSLSLE